MWKDPDPHKCVDPDTIYRTVLSFHMKYVRIPTNMLIRMKSTVPYLIFTWNMSGSSQICRSGLKVPYFIFVYLVWNTRNTILLTLLEWGKGIEMWTSPSLQCQIIILTGLTLVWIYYSYSPHFSGTNSLLKVPLLLGQITLWISRQPLPPPYLKT